MGLRRLLRLAPARRRRRPARCQYPLNVDAIFRKILSKCRRLDKYSLNVDAG